MAQLQVTAAASSYRDASRYENERKGVFGRSWLFMAHVSELAHEGDVVTATIAGFPLLVVRTKDGLKAFHNVCRHRAGPLFDEARGNCGAVLTCKYHGWAYALDGRLKSARDFGAAAGFDPRQFSLFDVRVETWRGFVFVNADKDAPALAALLAPLDARMGGRDLDRLVHSDRRTHDIACNWKLYVENYLEGYHIPLVHPALNAEVDASKYAVTVEGGVCFHHAPPRATDGVYDGLWAFVQPHLGVNVYGHGLMMERMVPLGLGATRLVYDYYLTPEIAGDPVARHRIIATSAVVTAEDKWICERVQTNIEAGIYEAGVLSPRHEAGVAWFQRLVAEALNK
ncbi:MAG: aromatic ring-hydroxylating dioxygenase subunit alpha [Alphaproteobacteria bacterium]|nr:aromatic ring-hydroxylating dioxygenase subunit alpha [Alphaproteobacteria bacterium]